MGDIITYASEYQFLSFEQYPFNDVDSLILCELSYMNFQNTSFCKGEFSLTLRDFYESEYSEQTTCHLISRSKDRILLDIIANSTRYGSIRAAFFVDMIDRDSEKQFSSITFRLSESVYYIAFRGTDGTLTGWKEDLNLSFLKDLPAQLSARDYAAVIMNRFSGSFYFGGHSKGGNLAIYAAMHMPEPQKDFLLAIYNHDGPGFLAEIYKSPEYQSIRSLIKKTVPQSAFVGLLLEQHDSDYTVVESDAFAIMQHDPFSWVTEQGTFVTIEHVDSFAKYTNQTLNQWIYDMDIDTRRKFVNTLFDLIYATGAETVYDLTENKKEYAKLLIGKLLSSDFSDVKILYTTFHALINASAGEMKHLFSGSHKHFIEKLSKQLPSLPNLLE